MKNKYYTAISLLFSYLPMKQKKGRRPLMDFPILRRPPSFKKNYELLCPSHAPSAFT